MSAQLREEELDDGLADEGRDCLAWVHSSGDVEKAFVEN